MERSLEDYPALWDLFEVIVRLKDSRECALFFRDLCTYSELAAMAERWNVVRLLAGDLSYREINERTGVSTATITRIAHWFHHGEGGYRLALERASSVEKKATPRSSNRDSQP